MRCLQIPDSSCADSKTISDWASVHKGNADFGAVFTTERRCAASILKVNRYVSDRFSYQSLASCEQVPDRSGSKKLGGRIGFHNMAALPLVLISAISNAVLNLQLCIMNLTALKHRKRRRKRLQLLLMLKDLRKRANGRRFPRARLFWVRPGRCNELWDNFIAQRVTAEELKENLCMNWETFLKLCDDLRPNSEGKATRMRMPLSVEKQVVVTLYYLEKGSQCFWHW